MKIECPHCGATCHDHKMHIHAPLCNAMPTPIEMADLFRTNSYITVAWFRDKYSCGFEFARNRLKLGGLTDKQIRRRGVAIRQRKMRANGKNRAGGNACAECEVLLNHPKVPAGKSGLCGWCITEKVTA